MYTRCRNVGDCTQNHLFILAKLMYSDLFFGGISIGKLPDLDEQSLHAGANIRLGKERTGSFHPEHALQHPEPLLQQVRRVSLQVVHTLPCHYLRTTAKTGVKVRMGKGITVLFNSATVLISFGLR